MSQIAPLKWRKASSSQDTYILPAKAAQPGLPIPAHPASRIPWMQGGPTTKPNHFPSLSDVSRHRLPISDERAPHIPLPLSSATSPTPPSSPASPRRPTRQAATRAKQRFSEVYAPLIIEEDTEIEDTTPAPTGATFSGPSPSLLWFSESSDDDEYVDDGDDESDCKRPSRIGMRNKRGNKRPRTADVERYYARLDNEKLTNSAGKAGTRKRVKLVEDRKAGSKAGPVRKVMEERKVRSHNGECQKPDGSMKSDPPWSSAEAKLVGGKHRMSGGEDERGRPDSDATLVWEREHGRPVSDITLVGE